MSTGGWLENAVLPARCPPWFLLGGPSAPALVLREAPGVHFSPWFLQDAAESGRSPFLLSMDPGSPNPAHTSVSSIFTRKCV